MKEMFDSWVDEINSYLVRIDRDKIDNNMMPWEFLDAFMEAAKIDELSGLEHRVATSKGEILDPEEVKEEHKITGNIYGKGEVEHGVMLKGNIFVDEDSVVKSGTRIEGDGYIGKETTVGPNAFLRGGFLLGDKVGLGHPPEVKHSIMLQGSCAYHYAYIGDSVVGRNCNLGAVTKFPNLRNDLKPVKVWIGKDKYETGLMKLGAIVGDNVKFGCGTTLEPGKFVPPNTHMYVKQEQVIIETNK